MSAGIQIMVSLMESGVQSLSAASASSSVSSAIVTAAVSEKTSGNSFALLILAAIKWIPGILYHLITFTTITLPTWLYRVFSMTLTFSLNATTLYVAAPSNGHADMCALGCL